MDKTIISVYIIHIHLDKEPCFFRINQRHMEGQL